MKFALGIIAAAIISTASMADDSIGKKLDQKADLLKGKVKSKMPASNPNEPTMAQKASAKKDELKAKTDAAAADAKAKLEAKKAAMTAPSDKPSATDKAKAAAAGAESKLDGAINNLGK